MNSSTESAGRNAEPIARSASLSRCRTWRYSLKRTWDAHRPAITFVGLNPSTADESQDDPTIRRCLGFARAWGHGSLTMRNLFAFRATNPRELRTVADPIGPRNDAVLRSPPEGPLVLCWGHHGELYGRSRDVLALLEGRTLMCLGTTANGEPRHPLYLPRSTRLEPYVPPTR